MKNSASLIPAVPSGDHLGTIAWMENRPVRQKLSICWTFFTAFLVDILLAVKECVVVQFRLMGTRMHHISAVVWSTSILGKVCGICHCYVYNIVVWPMRLTQCVCSILRVSLLHSQMRCQYLPSDWLERLLRGSLIVARGSSPQSPGQRMFMIFLVCCSPVRAPGL